MKRAGFTMIELIFVIVILGILAAVAVPKMTQTQGLARVTNVESYVASLNRSASADLWAQAIVDGNGSVATLNINNFMEIPEGYSVTNSGLLTNCANPAVTAIMTIGTSVIESAESIFCRDGNLTSPPKFGFSTDMNASVQNN